MIPVRAPSRSSIIASAANRGHERLLGGDRGFTLIEVLVGALMIVLIAAATATALISTAHTSADQRIRSQADQFATQDQERLRGLSDAQLTGLSQSRTVTVNGLTFTVSSVSTSEDTSGTSSCASTAAAAYYRIVSTVSWTENNATQNLVEDSLLSRPVTGDLRVQVTDPAGQQVPGLTVGAAGPSTQTSPTDSTGCVLFAGLIPGGYTVTMTDPGYITPTGATTPLTASATVTTTGVAVPTGSPFVLGLPGSLAGTFATSAATGSATAEADGMSWVGTDGVNTMSGVAPTSAAGVVTSAASPSTKSLFPFYNATNGYTGNYAAWGGRCAQQKPPTATSTSVTPGFAATATVVEPLLNLNVTYNGTAITTKPSRVALTFSAGGCTDSWTPTVATTKTANGWLVNPGQPYAASNKLTVCADYVTGGRTYGATITTGNTSLTGTNLVTVPIVTGGATC